MGCLPGHVLFVDPRQALGAVTALQANPTLPSIVDRYQRDTLGSRISTVTVAIDEILGRNNSSATPLLDLRQETVLSQVRGSLSAGFRSVEATGKDVDDMASAIDDLLSRVQRIRENAMHDIFCKPGENSKVEQALSLGMKEMNALLGSLSFWKMVWRVDEIGTLISAAIQGQWCKGLENQARNTLTESRILSSLPKPAYSTDRVSEIYPERTIRLCIQPSLWTHSSFTCP